MRPSALRPQHREQDAALRLTSAVTPSGQLFSHWRTCQVALHVCELWCLRSFAVVGLATYVTVTLVVVGPGVTTTRPVRSSAEVTHPVHDTLVLSEVPLM